MKKMIWLLLAVLPLALLSGCMSREDKALVELFRQREKNQLERTEARNLAGLVSFVNGEQVSTPGYGAEVTYALYETEALEPVPGHRYLYLQKNELSGTSWSRWQWDGEALHSTTAIPPQPRDPEQARLIGEFSLELEPMGAQIPRPDTDQRVLAQIRRHLEEEKSLQLWDFVAYVNTQELYAIVVTDGVNEACPGLFDTACWYQFEEGPEGLTCRHCWEFSQYPGDRLADWFYGVARADGVIRVSGRADMIPDDEPRLLAGQNCEIGVQP